MVWQNNVILGIDAIFQANLPVFCGLHSTPTCDLADVNGAF